MSVFDRWGGMIREGIGSEGWDGIESNGSLAPVGVYLYMAILEHRVTGEIRTFVAGVTLLR